MFSGWKCPKKHFILLWKQKHWYWPPFLWGKSNCECECESNRRSVGWQHKTFSSVSKRATNVVDFFATALKRGICGCIGSELRPKTNVRSGSETSTSSISASITSTCSNITRFLLHRMAHRMLCFQKRTKYVGTLDSTTIIFLYWNECFLGWLTWPLLRRK